MTTKLRVKKCNVFLDNIGDLCYSHCKKAKKQNYSSL